MSKPAPMKTLSEVMAILAKERGIQREFRMNANGEVHLQDSDIHYTASELKIVKSYRFEGDSNPDDNAVLYVIEDKLGNKGFMIDSYGAESNYPNDLFDEFIRNIPVNEKDEYNIY